MIAAIALVGVADELHVALERPALGVVVHPHDLIERLAVQAGAVGVGLGHVARYVDVDLVGLALGKLVDRAAAALVALLLGDVARLRRGACRLVHRLAVEEEAVHLGLRVLAAILVGVDHGVAGDERVGAEPPPVLVEAPEGKALRSRVARIVDRLQRAGADREEHVAGSSLRTERWVAA